MPRTRLPKTASAARRMAVRAGVALSLWAAVALAGCQLPVVFGGFGVFNTDDPGQPGGTQSGTQNPGNGQGGQPNTAPVSTTGGGVPQGDISVAGTAALDDRTSHDGIDVTLGSGERSTTKRTDVQGGYRFDKVAPGQYTLTVAKAGYRPQRLDVFLERNNQQLPAVSLTSPVTAVEINAATDTVYVAPADPKDFAILPAAVQLRARLVKDNGDKFDGNPSTIEWSSLDPARAGVSPDGLVIATPTASSGSVTISAWSKADPSASGSVVLEVHDPGSIADVRVLSLGGGRR